MKYKRIIFAGASFWLCVCGFMSCSDADNVEDLQEKTTRLSSEENIIETSEDSISIYFSILNEAGKPSTSFKYGENMLFRLSMKNKTDRMLMVSRNFEGFNDISWDNNFLRVFTAEGKDMGVPWTGMFLNKDNRDSWGFAGHLSCPWSYQNIETLLATSWSEYNPLLSFPLDKSESSESSNKAKQPKQPLPRGDYYTHFMIKFNSIPGDETTKKIFEVHLNFSIN